MDDLLMRLIDLAGQHAHHILIENGESELMPIFLLFVPDAPSVLIPAGWHNNREKQVLLALVRMKSHEIGAVAASFVSEAWSVKVKRPLDGQRSLDDAIESALPARENPERIEIVNAAATDGVRQVSRIWQMVRDRPGGKLIQLLHMQDADSTERGDMTSPLMEGIIRPR